MAKQREAVQRADEAEARLAKARAESDALWRSSASRRGDQIDVARCEEEARALRQRVADARAASDERSERLQECSERIEHNGWALAKLRSEQETKANVHGSLRSEVGAINEQLRSGARGSQDAGRALESCRQQQAQRDQERQAETSKLRERAHGLETELERCRAKLRVCEVAADASKTSCVEGRGALALIRCESDELDSKAKQRDDQRRREVESLKEQVLLLERSKEAAKGELEHLCKNMGASEERLTRCRQTLDEARQALTRERQHATGQDSQSKSSLRELCSRAEALAWQFEDERKRGLELSKEVSAAYDVAQRVQAHSVAAPREGPHSSPVRRRRRHSLQASFPRPEPRGFRRTRTRLQRELGQLRHWRHEAAGSVQRMSENLQVARTGYARQLRYGQELEAAMGQLGQRAQSAIQPGGVEDDAEQRTPWMAVDGSRLPEPRDRAGRIPAWLLA